MTQVRPLVYYYKIYKNNGKVINQYDENYKGRNLDDINMDNIVKLGLYPFDEDLASKVNDAGTPVRSIPFLSSYEINLKPNERMIYYRQAYIQTEEYHLCDKCGKEFAYNSLLPTKKSKYPSPICPHCGAYDNFYCKKCDKEYIFEETSHGLCPECKGHLQRNRYTSKQHSREKRWNEYNIGKQVTINNTNYKTILTISESGDCIVN